MRSTALALGVVVMLVMAAAAQAGVYNVSLAASGDQGVSGTATTISGKISGVTPYYNVEVNARMSQSPPANMVYELWLVDKDANYKLSLGAFNGMMFSNRQRLVHFEGASPYDSIAVTIESAHDTNPLPGTIVATGSLPGTSVSAADFSTMAVLPDDEVFQQQVITQRFALASRQVMDLRMMGWSYSDIAVVANAAAKCNRPVSEVARMLQDGRSWSDIAQTCNTTIAELLSPVPPAAVAGAMIELPPAARPMPVVAPPIFYQRGANNVPIITQSKWNELSARGYKWRDVAIAANISATTGKDVGDLLRMKRVLGMTWSQIIADRGLKVDRMKDVSGWPFSRDGEMMEMPAPATSTTPMPTTPPSY